MFSRFLYKNKLQLQLGIQQFGYRAVDMSVTHKNTQDVSSIVKKNPFCIDCMFYVPMEHSPLYPNSACRYYQSLHPALMVRSKPDLCGEQGKHFQPRIKPCKCSHPSSVSP